MLHVAGKLRRRKPPQAAGRTRLTDPRRREDEEHKTDLRSWRERERERDSRSGEEEENENGEGKEREHATRENGGGGRFVDKEGRGPCLVDGNKGDFGYLKPKLAIVYSF